jgi:hypothetical protein
MDRLSIRVSHGGAAESSSSDKPLISLEIAATVVQRAIQQSCTRVHFVTVKTDSICICINIWLVGRKSLALAHACFAGSIISAPRCVYSTVKQAGKQVTLRAQFRHHSCVRACPSLAFVLARRAASSNVGIPPKHTGALFRLTQILSTLLVISTLLLRPNFAICSSSTQQQQAGPR